MNYILKNHNWSDDIVSTVMMFYPNEKYTLLTSPEGMTIESILENGAATAVFYDNGNVVYKHTISLTSEDEKSVRYGLRMSAYHCLMRVKPVKMAWGALTGVRPAKIVWSMWDMGYSDEQALNSLINDYCVSKEKAQLALTVAKNEKKIVERGSKDKIGLYIGIPFCPTRCLYCSFTSYPLKQYSDRVDKYLDALETEMRYVSGVIADKTIESLYIGGGTPTSLNETQLDRLLNMTAKYFKTPMEYTVEAGRPDTITRQKLKSLKEYNVGRISINPQTLNDKTLKLIGREHSTQMFLDAFAMAREEGHKHINTDIILGLPGEGEDEVKLTMEGLKKLSPESITVHTLAVKRASRLKETLEKYSMTELELMESLLDISAEYTADMGMHPYYMYRQKNMVGNFENVGYCKPDCECVYNVQIMEEKQSIWALGAGGSTKLVEPETDRIERIFNVKSVDDYITRIDEMIDRKRAAENIFK
jgi:oxygen-independent coproporphyrinogen-3 oxidase